jgi:hypothetical protein
MSGWASPKWKTQCCREERQDSSQGAKWLHRGQPAVLKAVIILRGNHECSELHVHHGFQDECYIWQKHGAGFGTREWFAALPTRSGSSSAGRNSNPKAPAEGFGGASSAGGLACPASLTNLLIFLNARCGSSGGILNFSRRCHLLGGRPGRSKNIEQERSRQATRDTQHPHRERPNDRPSKSTPFKDLSNS